MVVLLFCHDLSRSGGWVSRYLFRRLMGVKRDAFSKGEKLDFRHFQCGSVMGFCYTKSLKEVSFIKSQLFFENFVNILLKVKKKRKKLFFLKLLS
jgi:hypothetical protein